MAIALEDIDKLRFDLREDVHPLDVRRKQKRAGGRHTELGLRMEDLKLFDRAVSGFVYNEVAVFTEDVTLKEVNISQSL